MDNQNEYSGNMMYRNEPMWDRRYSGNSYRGTYTVESGRDGYSGRNMRHSYSRGDDARMAKWFPVKNLPELAFDHQQIIETALERIKQRIHFEPIGFHLLDKEFTMPQLQNIYLAILNPPKDDIKLRDRRNFPKKMLKLGYIKETGKKMTGNPYRSPKLYTFDEEAYVNAKKIGMRLEF